MTTVTIEKSKRDGFYDLFIVYNDLSHLFTISTLELHDLKVEVENASLVSREFKKCATG